MSAIRYTIIAIITVIPRLQVLSLSHAKKKTTGKVIMFPIAVKAFDCTREKPSDIIMLGV
jgi:hypothetical protein